MRFCELRLKGGRNYAKGDFAIVDVNGASMFVGTVSEVRDADARQNDPRPKHARIAYPVSSVEYAVPMEEPECGEPTALGDRCVRSRNHDGEHSAIAYTAEEIERVEAERAAKEAMTDA